MNQSTFVWLAALSLTAFTATAQETATYRMIEDEAHYEILTPALSCRKTAKIQFASGLQAYLVSDPEIDQSAAAMSVQAGSWQDPKTYPGMAHFLEHMLFMGNKAYPQEFEYMQYIHDNGGKVNAFTAPDRTVYMFSINNEAFQGALDRFSHFFIDPLFSTSCINRELHAVDQEHSKNIENDMWREYMVFKATSNPEHPNAKFSTGNAETLSGIPQQALIEWYQTHYSADKMHLVLLSPLPMDQLLALASSHFSDVPNRKLANMPEAFTAIASSDQKGHFVHIKPVKDLRVLSLVWELPPEFANIDEKWTSELAVYVMNQQSEDSLLKQLKREKLVEGLSASSDRYGQEALFFRLDIQLTDYGISHMDTVIARCFQMINRLKQTGIPLSLFEEMKTISQMQYQYQSREDAFDWITDVAYNLVDENLATFPEKTAIPSEYDPQSILRLIDCLTPQSCLYFTLVEPAKLNITTDKTEKWMNVAYTIKPIASAKLLSWQQALVHPKIQLPPENPFVPKSLPQIAATLAPSKEAPIPTVLSDDEKSKIYFAQDQQYSVPETSLIFHVKSPLLDGSAKSSAMMDVWETTLTENLSSTLFFAKSAGISSSFSYEDMKFTFGIQGYSEKAPMLAKSIFAAMANVACSMDDFEIYKASLLSSYDNASKELPVKQAMETLSNVVQNTNPTYAEKYAALEAISFEEFSAFSKQWIQTLYVEGIIFGSLTSPEAKTFWNEAKASLSASQPYLVSEQNKQNVLVLPPNRGPYKIVQNTNMLGNGVVLLVQEGAFSFSKRASQLIIGKALQEAFFETLRTKQQTAYIAQSWPSEVERQLFQSFAVQSSTHSPENLLMRFEMFLEDFNKRFVEVISEERFANLKKMQITSLQIPPDNMAGMASRLSSLAFEYDGDFLWIQKQIDALEALTYDNLVQDAHEFLSHENQRRIAVLMEGVVPEEKQFQYETVAADEIRKLGTFVSYK